VLAAYLNGIPQNEETWIPKALNPGDSMPKFAFLCGADVLQGMNEVNDETGEPLWSSKDASLN